MNRIEAENLYQTGMEPTVTKLIEYHNENIQLKDESIKLKEKIAMLEKDSQNSSKPPSTDSFKGGNGKEDKKGKSKKRNAGGQPGHKGSKRNVLLGCIHEISQRVNADMLGAFKKGLSMDFRVRDKKSECRWCIICQDDKKING